MLILFNYDIMGFDQSLIDPVICTLFGRYEETYLIWNIHLVVLKFPDSGQ